MEQQRRHGIPASVTLAQGILESANGKSQLSVECNNHFGIKASPAWLRSGRGYGVYSDDRPNEKFCKYDSVGDSYEHHSQVLKNNGRYASCFKLEATDYKGWCNGLQKAGYASSQQYAGSLISVIERMDLTRFDKMAESVTQSKTEENSYSFPLARKEFMLVTSPYGNRRDPMDAGKMQFHRGIDIKCNNEPVLATENGGKVVGVNTNAGSAGGRSVTVEYTRADGSKVQTTCMHLESVAVKVGDTVSAGQQLGISGNSGSRTTGPHLHFEVKRIDSNGASRQLDPSAYLAEIAEKGEIRLTAQHNGQNLIAKYSPSDSPQASAELNPQTRPDDWMKKLLSSEDSGVAFPSTDPVMEMAVSMFTSLLALAVQIDGKSDSEEMAAATEAAVNRRIDLSSLAGGAKSCVMHLREGKTPLLAVTTAQGSFNHELTTAVLSRLSSALNDPSLSTEAKSARVTSLIGNIMLSEQLSQNFNAQVGRDQSSGLQR